MSNLLWAGYFYCRKLVQNEKGEGMVGWIVGAMLTVAIVVAIHGFVSGWLGDFWDKLQGNIESIV